MTKTFNCPNCGAGLTARLALTRMVDCPHCDSTVVLDGDALRAAGRRGVMLDAPSLLAIGQAVEIAGRAVTPLGHARFSYGPGWWDEFWCDDGDDGVWVSVDEGDVVIERPIPEFRPQRPARPAPGHEVEYGDEIYAATEAETAECVALRGEWPEEQTVGERHDYVNYLGRGGLMLSLEYWPGGETWTAGRWVDPFAVRAL